MTAGQAKGGLDSLFSAERARVDFFLCGNATDRYTLMGKFQIRVTGFDHSGKEDFPFAMAALSIGKE